jgi:hypothetical protein
MKTQIITNDAFFIDIIRYCEANNIPDIDDFTSQCLKSGFYIEKYGVLNHNIESIEQPKEIIREVEKIVEVQVDRIVEKIVEIDRIVEVPVDRIVEITKEVPIYKEIIKEVQTGGVRVEIKEIEIIKEVPVIQEVFVIKEVHMGNMECENELSDLKMAVNSMNEELINKNRIIEDYRRLFSDMTNQSARYHKSSNIKIR